MTLHLYMARRFLISFAIIFFAFGGILALVDLTDQVRRFADTRAQFPDILTLTILSVPSTLYLLLPLVILIATVTLFLGLARSSEMVVTRAAGRSALRTLVSPAVTVGLLGVIAVVAFNPIVAATSKEYDARSIAFTDPGSSSLSIGADDIWLRQGSADGQTVIRAKETQGDGTQLFDVTFVTIDAFGTPVSRIDADQAVLMEGAWQLSQAKFWQLNSAGNAEASSKEYPVLNIPTDLTLDRIRDSFGAPSDVPIWDLPEFLEELAEAGFSARRHAMWFHMELAQPAFWIAMLLIGASFTMRHYRGGGAGQRVLYAIMLGFGLYFLRNFAQILGETGQMPVLLAAWAPPLAAIGLSFGVLLHLEDG